MVRRIALLSAVLLVILVAAPASAITYGAPDGDGHPYVGLMIFYDPQEIDPRFPDPGAWFSCSGTLMSPTVFLTAGHCTYGIGEDGAPTADGSGGNDVWISFESSDALDGLPPSSTFVGQPNGNHLRYEAWVSWLNASDKWTRGTAYPHPEYDAGFPNTRDVGVVELAAEDGIDTSTYGALPDLGYLNQLATRRGVQRSGLFVETVGYGMLGVKPVTNNNPNDARYRAISMIVNLRSALTGGYNLQTSNTPGLGTGTGGSCFGDSGGPVFAHANSNVVVAVVSFGLNNNCKGADFAYRADIADTQGFLSDFGL